MQEQEYIRCRPVVHARVVRTLETCKPDAHISARYSGIPSRITCKTCRARLGWSKRQ